MTAGRTDPRLAAHRILAEVADGRFADRAAERHLAELEPAARRLAVELAYGSLRLRARLDAELDRFVDRPLQRLDPQLLDWLRLGLYQLRETRIPEHAAVNETVAGARRTVGRGPAGLVNAVLRRAAGAGPSPDGARLDEDPVGFLTGHGSHPEWLVRRWLARWSKDDVRRLVEHDNRAPPAVIRALEPRDRVEKAAARAGLEVAPLPDWPRSFALIRGDPARLLAHLRAVIQDPAASAVVDYAAPDAGGVLLDACAAPGGKAALLAAALGEETTLVAADRSPRRLKLVVRTAARLGLSLRPVAMDARQPALERARTVLLDVPCTGTGVLGRRADARWRIRPEDLSSLASLQRELLDACARLVEPGGLLVYSTCSLEPEENERQVDEFLRRNGRFKRERPDAAGRLPDGSLTEEGDLFVKPWRYGTDGSYAARLRAEGHG